MAGCVTGGVPHFERHAGQGKAVAVGEIGVLLRRGELLPVRWDEPEDRLQLGDRIGRKEVIVGMDVSGRPGALDNVARSPCVVDVTVGDEQRHGEEVMPFHQRRDRFDVGRGIDNDGLATFLRCDDIAVRHSRPHFGALDDHPPPPGMRR